MGQYRILNMLNGLVWIYDRWSGLQACYSSADGTYVHGDLRGLTMVKRGSEWWVL